MASLILFSGAGIGSMKRQLAAEQGWSGEQLWGGGKHGAGPPVGVTPVRWVTLDSR